MKVAPDVEADRAARRAVEDDLDSTLFLEAGAGSGKTSCLVNRFVQLVDSGVPADSIAAITFTEKAASELVERIRSELHSRGATAEAAQSVARAERYTAMFALPAVMLTLIWASPVILVFISREFLPAAPILQLLCLVALLRVLNRPWSVALRGADRPGLTSQVSIVATCLGLALMLLLVPRSIPHIGLDDLPGLGGQGAALALLGTELFVLVALRWLCYRHLGMRPSPQLLRQLLAALLMLTTVVLMNGTLWQVASMVIVARWYELFGMALLGGTLYFALLALLGGLTHRDLRYLWHAFHPREMGSYVRDELRR